MAGLLGTVVGMLGMVALTVEAGGTAFTLHQGRVGAGHRRAGDLVANSFKFLQEKKGIHGTLMLKNKAWYQAN